MAIYDRLPWSRWTLNPRRSVVGSLPRRVHKQVKLTQGLEAGWWELQVARVIKVESLLRARRGWVKADKGQRWRGRSEGGASWAGRTVAAAKRNRNNGRIQDSCDRRLRGKEAGWNAGLHHVSSLCLRFILTRIFPSGNKTTLASNLTPDLTSKLTFLPTFKPTSKLTPKLTSKLTSTSTSKSTLPLPRHIPNIQRLIHGNEAADTTSHGSCTLIHKLPWHPRASPLLKVERSQFHKYCR